MTAIITFFQGIGDAVTAAIDFLLSAIQDIAYVVELTGSFVVQIPTYFSWLPAPVLAVITSIFVVVVIYKILGRE